MAIFPLPFVIVALVQLPFAKADDPNVSGLWGDVRWIVGVQIFVLAVLIDGASGRPDALDALSTRIAYAAALFFVVAATFAMVLRSRHFLALYGLQWAVIVAAVIVNYAAIVAVTGFENWDAYPDFDLKVKLLALSIAAGGGMWFLLTSRQSKNTFVR